MKSTVRGCRRASAAEKCWSNFASRTHRARCEPSRSGFSGRKVSNSTGSRYDCSVGRFARGVSVQEGFADRLTSVTETHVQKTRMVCIGRAIEFLRALRDRAAIDGLGSAGKMFGVSTRGSSLPDSPPSWKRLSHATDRAPDSKHSTLRCLVLPGRSPPVTTSQ